MATEKQIAANRANAQKSTGPRTIEGKSITRLNSTRDGFTRQVITLAAEDLPIFEEFKSGLIKDLAPKTTMELSLATSIAWDTWRLNHLRAVEMNMYAVGSGDSDTRIECDDIQIHTALAAALTFGKEAGKFALMSVYEQRMNRSLHKNLATLRELQAERIRHHKKDRAEEVLLACYSDIKGLPYQAPATPTLNGSVFSNDEIFAATNRLTTLKVAKSALWKEPLKVQYAGASSSGAVSTQSSQEFSTDLPHKTGPGTATASWSATPETGANASFLSR